MIQNVKFGSSLAFLILAALTGLAGFFIVYHYASFERPIRRFAVVIDAGSTQTRSNLYSITLDLSRLDETTASAETTTTTPLSNIVQVREVAGCVNGGPLATISSPDDADRLLGKCLPKFARKIKRLDFMAKILDNSEKDSTINNEDDEDDESRHYDLEELDKQMALLNHRVNTITHIHLGATAGMRALELLDPAKADQKIHWIQDAITRSNSNMLAGTIYMNPGFIGIIEGSSEASFGWLSVNFACDKLQIDTISGINHEQRQNNQGDAKYSIQENNSAQQTTVQEDQQIMINSIGTLELGGASAQMAFQVQSSTESLLKVAFDESMQLDSLELFDNNYHLATRSDLCLGMSQAILRTNYILMRNYFDQLSPTDQMASRMIINNQEVEIENPCQQKGSRVKVSKATIDSILDGACLEVDPKQKSQSEKFKQFIVSSPQQIIDRLRIIGTGDVIKCDRLLSKLIEPEECKDIFSLCPDNKNKQQPPKGMPFVTISGYNKALQVLNLSRQQQQQQQQQSSDQIEFQQITKQSTVIEEKLGGHPIDFREFYQKTESFCSLNVDEFPMRFPKMNKAFYDVNCLQMIYIRKLLTEFYQFKPETSSWSQLRFLLFPIGAEQTNSEQQQQQLKSNSDLESKKNQKIDIGWTLGLLLNATSWELTTDEKDRPQDVIYHHGASIQFIIRTTIFLMFSCVFIAGSIVVVSFVLAKRKFRTAYICHSAQVNTGQISPPNSL